MDFDSWWLFFSLVVIVFQLRNSYHGIYLTNISYLLLKKCFDKVKQKKMSAEES